MAHLGAGHALPGPTPDSPTLMLSLLAVYGVSHPVVSNSSQPCGLIAHQAPPYMEFPRQKYWSGLPCPSPGNLPDPGIEPRSASLQADSLPSRPPGKPFFLAGLRSNITSSESPYWIALVLWPFTLLFQLSTILALNLRLCICLSIYFLSYHNGTSAPGGKVGSPQTPQRQPVLLPRASQRELIG